MEPRNRRIWGVVGALALLAGYAAYLAVHRIYQVDEAQNLFMLRVLGSHQTASYFANALLWMVGPLAKLARSAQDSASLFFWGRMVFLAVFVLNIYLLTLNTGLRLRSERGLAALLGAATLAPLWDYGFEFRHDNLILTGLLLMWWLGRTRPRGRGAYALIGFLTVVLLFVAFKSFAYVLPLSAALVIFPPEGHGEGRVRLGLSWGLGALLGGLLVVLVYHLSGFWPVYLAGFKSGISGSEGGSRFGPWLALSRLLTQTPLLHGLVVAALLWLGWDFRLRRWQVLTWDGPLPEALLFLGALGILMVNPTPFPYNLVNLVPFAYLLATRFVMPFLDDLGTRPKVQSLAVGVICITHIVPFAAATWRHLDWTNDRQETLMRTAEALTDPVTDPVYDAIGMVPTRPSIGFHWYLHSLNVKTFMNGKDPSISQMLAARPPAVFIPSYRTDWLSEADHRFIQERYVPLANDFWVLGKVLPPGGGAYQVVHAGRYQVLGLKQGTFSDLPSGTLNEGDLGRSPVVLTTGPQQILCPPDIQPVVVWVGPRLEHIPQIGPGDHRRLFVNWY